MRVAPVAMRGAMMVIYAETKFGCCHRYIATADQQHLLFVCDQCQHRTELLPLDRGGRLGRVVTFPMLANAEHSVRHEKHDDRQTSNAKAAADWPA
jgi:hypothetical protein